MSTPFTEALATLNDRALRRLLGARAFLRGYDYVRRGAVADTGVDLASAHGTVRGSEPEPYAVRLRLLPEGFDSECSCPAFSKIHGHCKHVAALLIALRDEARPRRHRDEPESSPGFTTDAPYVPHAVASIAGVQPGSAVAPVSHTSQGKSPRPGRARAAAPSAGRPAR